MATNPEKHKVQYIKKNMGMKEIFDGVFASSGIGYKKPEKEFYKFILDDLKKRHKIQTNEIIFFDDDQKNIDGANNVGIESVFYKGVEDLEVISG